MGSGGARPDFQSAGSFCHGIMGAPQQGQAGAGLGAVVAAVVSSTMVPPVCKASRSRMALAEGWQKP